MLLLVGSKNIPVNKIKWKTKTQNMRTEISGDEFQDKYILNHSTKGFHSLDFCSQSETLNWTKSLSRSQKVTISDHLANLRKSTMKCKKNVVYVTLLLTSKCMGKT